MVESVSIYKAAYHIATSNKADKKDKAGSVVDDHELSTAGLTKDQVDLNADGVSTREELIQYLEAQGRAVQLQVQGAARLVENVEGTDPKLADLFFAYMEIPPYAGKVALELSDFSGHQAVWDALVDTGYMSAKGEVLEAFTGNRDDFNLGGSLSEEAQDIVFNILKDATSVQLTTIIEKLLSGDDLNSMDTRHLNQIVNDPDGYLDSLMEAVGIQNADDVDQNGGALRLGAEDSQRVRAELSEHVSNLQPVLSRVLREPTCAAQLQIDDDIRVGLYDAYFAGAFAELKEFCYANFQNNEAALDIAFPSIEHAYYVKPGAEDAYSVTQGGSAPEMTFLTMINGYIASLAEYKGGVPKVPLGACLLRRVDHILDRKFELVSRDRHVREIKSTLHMRFRPEDVFAEAIGNTRAALETSRGGIHVRVEDIKEQIKQGPGLALAAIRDFQAEYADVIETDFELMNAFMELEDMFERLCDPGILDWPTHVLDSALAGSKLATIRYTFDQMIDNALGRLGVAEEEYLLAQDLLLNGKQGDAVAHFDTCEEQLDALDQFLNSQLDNADHAGFRRTIQIVSRLNPGSSTLVATLYEQDRQEVRCALEQLDTPGRRSLFAHLRENEPDLFASLQLFYKCSTIEEYEANLKLARGG